MSPAPQVFLLDGNKTTVCEMSVKYEEMFQF